MATHGRTVWVVLLAAALLASPAPAVAGDDEAQAFLEKIRADKKLLVSMNMQLTDAEAKAFWPVYSRYQDELFILRARTANLIMEYAKAYENMNNETAKKLLEENLAIETQGAQLRQNYLAEFRKILPDIKVARYYQIENKINAVLMYELARNIPLMQGK
ncbi:MAG TPA: hypothetical protein VLS90_19170 [Thermodesulfobacteriota bacterium]|nr:hypothetical protein [Thermodesulfobacteriota bacterium]